jgi:cysteine desulfurase
MLRKKKKLKKGETAMNRVIYMDNNATTRVAPEVLEEMMPYLTELYGNPSSMHTFGGQVAHKIRTARQQVAALLGCDADEIIFTSCGTESDNTAIVGTLTAMPNKRTVITTRVEHPAVLSPCRNLEQHGFRIIELAVDKHGNLDMAEFESALSEDTVLVTVMYANNETGVVFPVEKMAAVCKEKGIPFHTDAVQAVGKIPLNMKKSGIDMLSLSWHILQAPNGLGALYFRRGTRLSPYLLGGLQ